MRGLVEAAGLQDRIHVESAGTADYHTGKLPDGRAIDAAARRGIHLKSRAKQFRAADWERFDYVVAMDGSNWGDLSQIKPPSVDASKLRLLRSFEGEAFARAPVPDPYYGGPEGFEEVLDLCEVACAALLEYVRREHSL